MYREKHDSVVHKYGNAYYHNVDRLDSNFHIITDNPNVRWLSEVNTINNMVPAVAGHNGGFYQLCRILNKFEEELPTKNVIKL